MSPQTVSAKLAWIAQASGRMDVRADGQQQSCRLRVGTLQVLGPQGPLLTNRMSELLTYGSVGGGGSNPASYPAPNAGGPRQFSIPTPLAARVGQFVGQKNR